MARGAVLPERRGLRVLGRATMIVMATEQTILITGITGKQGGAVARTG